MWFSFCAWEVELISVCILVQNVADQIAFQVAGGLTALEHILQGVVPAANVNTVSRIPPK